MEITTVDLTHVIVRAGSNFVTFDDEDRSFIVHVVRIVLDGDQLTAECRLWRSHTFYWERANYQGREPHEKALVLGKDLVAIPLEDFVDVADVAHASEWKKIPQELRGGVFFFSHLEDENGKIRRVGKGAFQTQANEAVVRRGVGMTIRAYLRTKLKKRGHRAGDIHLSFPFPKDDVVAVLSQYFNVMVKGNTSIFCVRSLEALDELCGPGWDYQQFQDGFWNAVTGFFLKIATTNHFRGEFRISNRRPCEGNYREISLAEFKF